MRIPNIVSGKVIPSGVDLEIIKQEKENMIRKQSRKHDWIIAIFSVIGGGVMGFLTSLIFWLCTK